MARGEVKYRLTIDAKEFSSGVKVAKKEFEDFVKELGGGVGVLGKVAGAMGPVGILAAAAMGAATVGVVGFAKVTLDAAEAAVDFAGKISDLSTQTGISGEALQKLGFAGSMVGTTMESMATAVSKMQQHMVKAPEDFKQLGISLDKIKNLAPEKQFEAVGKAIQRIEDPAQRTAATIAFFGKSGQEAMKTLSVGMDEAAQQAERLGIIMGDSTREALDSLGDSVTVLKTTWDHLLMNFGGAIAEMPEVKQAVDAITEALGEMSRFVLANKADIQSLVRIAIVPMADAVVDLFHAVQFLVSGLVTLKNLVSGGWMEKIAKALLPKSSGSSGVGEGSGLSSSSRIVKPDKPPGWIDPAELKKAQAAREAARKQVEAADTEHARILESIRHDTAMKELKLDEAFWRKQVQMADDYGKKLLDKIVKEQQDASNARLAAHQITQYGLEQEARQLDESAEKWATWGDAIAVASDNIGGVFGDALRGLGGAFDGLASREHQAAENLRQFGDAAMTTAQKVQAVAGALNAASAAYQSGFESKSVGKGALQGAAKGAKAGAAFGPYGAIIGGVVGAGIGIFGAKKGQAAELKQLNEQMKQLQDEAKRAGVTLDHAFDPKNAKSMKQALKDLQEAMDMKPLQDGFNQAMLAAHRAGITFDHAFDTSSANGLKNAIDEINAALGLQTEAQNALHDAMDRYGISIGQLGPEFAKQELDKQAAQLLQDYSLLNAAGVDHTLIIGQMGPALNQYVQQAIQSGTAIPESMRPIVQALIDQHGLLDENGRAYGSVEEAGISFTATMSEQFGTLIGKINELVNALMSIPNINRTITVERRYTGGGGGEDDGGRDGDPATPLASGFEGMVNSPRKFLVGEAGPEYMSVRKPGEAAAGFNVNELKGELRGLRDDFKRYQQSQAGSIRDAVLLGRA